MPCELLLVSGVADCPVGGQDKPIHPYTALYQLFLSNDVLHQMVCWQILSRYIIIIPNCSSFAPNKKCCRKSQLLGVCRLTKQRERKAGKAWGLKISNLIGQMNYGSIFRVPFSFVRKNPLCFPRNCHLIALDYASTKLIKILQAMHLRIPMPGAGFKGKTVTLSSLFLYVYIYIPFIIQCGVSEYTSRRAFRNEYKYHHILLQYLR